MGSLKALVYSSVLATMASGAAFAADLLPPPPAAEPPMAVAAAAEFSGWYLRGDVGAGINRTQSVSSTFAAGFVVPGLQYDRSSIRGHGIVGIGAGYQFNDWFRADVTGEYNFGSRWQAIESYADVAYGAAGRCMNLYNAKVGGGAFLLNGYVDLGTWYHITPYVGAGVGMAHNKVGTIQDIGINMGGLGVGPGVSKWNFAWALMAGAAVQIAPNWKLDFGYRYLDKGSATTGEIVCLPVGIPCGFERHKFRFASHDFRIGLRYSFDSAAPLAAPGPLVRKY
ncbi:MAG: porin family protein [Alphaproteobacteria bacterium]|nr:porin family protein [Alphaproteobacteria bacterium]